MANNNRSEVTGWVGWVYFAGFMMILLGIFQVIAGLAALLNDTYFVVRENQLLIFDFTTWGWINLVLGMVVISAGSAVTSGKTWGRVIGVFLASLSLIANFAFVDAYPVWSVIMMVVDIFIIYALTVHGAEARE